MVCPDIMSFYDLAETFCGLWIAIYGNTIRELGFFVVIIGLWGRGSIRGLVLVWS